MIGIDYSSLPNEVMYKIDRSIEQALNSYKCLKKDERQGYVKKPILD